MRIFINFSETEKEKEIRVYSALNSVGFKLSDISGGGVYFDDTTTNQAGLDQPQEKKEEEVKEVNICMSCLTEKKAEELNKDNICKECEEKKELVIKEKPENKFLNKVKETLQVLDDRVKKNIWKELLSSNLGETVEINTVEEDLVYKLISKTLKDKAKLEKDLLDDNEDLSF